MSSKQHFCASIEDAGGGGAYVTIPFDVEQVFGKKRLKVKATIDGEPYRGSLVRMGTPHHMLIILKQIRQKIGKTFGDEVTVEIEEDLEPRQVELPLDLQRAFQANPEARQVFDRLSYTHQKEYARWVSEARRPETRQRRIQQTMDMLTKEQREH
jgi:hypothetical protein